VIASALGNEPPLSRYLLSSLRAGLSYSTLDHPEMPSRGSAAGAWIEVADRRLGSDVDLAGVHAWASHHRPLGPLTLHLGAKASGVTGARVPIAERLYLDGSRDVRGLDLGAIGPDAGARYKLTARAELEAPLIPTIGLSIVGFVDAGTVTDTLERAVLGYSAGFGILWRSPIGPLRFDWAFPFGEGPPRFVFGIGSSF
jgi:outer membrane protein assembly factor BamA